MPQAIHLWRFLRLAPRVLLAGAMLLAGTVVTRAQVSPAEILNPRLKALEKTYLSQLIALHRIIGEMKFPFPFSLNRYVNVDPKQQAAPDTRGLEFVLFRGRVVLKVSGSYEAAFNIARMNPNERADRAFEDVIVPILRQVAAKIPPNGAFDSVGFEISYHVRNATSSYDYEGKENLVVVFNRADVDRFLAAGSRAQRQDILNRSQVFLDGKDFGLALGERKPIAVAALDRSATPPPSESVSAPAATASAQNEPTANTEPLPDSALAVDLRPGSPGPAQQTLPPVQPGTTAPVSRPVETATPADLQQLQSRYQPQLDALNQIGVAKLHFVGYAPPSFVLFRNQIYLQITLRNPAVFDPSATSIYKRAARSFDLFLAPQLRAIVARLPGDARIRGLDVTVLNELGAEKSSSEAVEFICPLGPLQDFVNAGITNQQLIDQSVVLVNGVRIALNLQLVE
jgi:hypothetical protein